MIDSGNTWRSALSKGFFLSLGFTEADIRPVSVKKLGTAKEGASLKVLGESKQTMYLSTRHSKTKFCFNPIIVDGLSHPVNISGPFLVANKWDNMHSEGGLRIQGRLVPLQNRSKAEAPVSYLYALEDTSVAPHSIQAVRLAAAEVVAGTMPAGDGYVRGDAQFMDNTDLHPMLNALSNCDSEGCVKAAAMNTRNEAITIRKGQRYGTFTRLCDNDEWDSVPWRMAAMEPVRNGRGRQKSNPADPGRARETRQSKHAEYIKRFAASAKAAAEAKAAAPPTKDPTTFSIAERRTWLIEQFKLKDSPFLQTPENLRDAVDALLVHWDLFSHDGSFGKTDVMTHRIITEDVPPIKCRYKAVNPALEADLKQQLQLWLDHDVIEPSCSSWSFNLVAAKKKGGKIRWW